MSSESKAETPPSKYTSKLNDLLAFLEAADTNLDKDNEEPSRLSKEASGAGVSQGPGLSDVSNRHPGAAKGQAVKSLSSGSASRSKPPTKALVRRQKRSSFVWEDWEESSFLAALDSLDDSPEKENDAPKATPAGSDDKSAKGLPADAQQQLAALKEMSEQISTRAANMKVELEQKTKLVEALHQERVKAQSEHAQQMKEAKQEWDQRLAFAQAKRDKFMDEQTQQREALLQECEALERQISTAQTDTEKATRSEQEMCERLKRDGAQDLEQAKTSWAQAEKNELNARDRRISGKLKKDAAKKVEPKLKQLMEGHKEELERLEREAARELDVYKLELYKLSNEEYRRETLRIRADERQRAEKLQSEWLEKLESSRLESEVELKRTRSEHEQRAKLMQQQFDADAQRIRDAQEGVLGDAEEDEQRAMQQARVCHERELEALGEEHLAKMVETKRSCEAELKQWKASREDELLKEEENTIEEDHGRMKSKVEAEIEVVKQRLDDERREKMAQKQLELNKEQRALKSKLDSQLEKLQRKLEQAQRESTALRQRESDESSLVGELQAKLAKMKEELCEKEDAVSLQEQRLSSYLDDHDCQLKEIKRDGERRLARSQAEYAALEKELDRLHASQPKQKETLVQELESLKASNAKEISLAEGKVSQMLSNKQAILEQASAKLLRLRQETAEIESDLDNARTAKVLGHK